MSRLSALRGVGVLAFTIAVGLVGIAAPVAAATPSRAAKRSSARPKLDLRNELRQTGIVVELGMEYGVPGLSASLGEGFVITPVEDATHKRAIAAYTYASGGLAIFSKRRTFSSNPRFRSIETAFGPVSKGSAIYGDRVQVPIIPGFVFVGASRKGGLGLSIGPLRLPFLFGPAFTFPLARGVLSIYVTNPRLTRPANWILDQNDRLMGKLDRLFARINARFTRMKLRLRDRWRPQPTPDDGEVYGTS